MGKTDDILVELRHQRDIQGKIFDKIEGVKEDVNEKHIEVLKEIGTLKTEIAVHKVKSGFFGTIGGAVAYGISIGIKFLIGGNR